MKICEFITLEMSCNKSTYLRTHLFNHHCMVINYLKLIM
jgi:hypothetical protein